MRTRTVTDPQTSVNPHTLNKDIYILAQKCIYIYKKPGHINISKAVTRQAVYVHRSGQADQPGSV